MLKAFLILVTIAVIFDVFLLPHFLHVLDYVLENQIFNPDKVSELFMSSITEYPFGIELLQNETVREMWMFFQIFLLGAIAYVLLNVSEKNKTPDISSGEGEYGTSRWQTKQEIENSFKLWKTDKPLEKSGLVVGAKAKKQKSKFWLETADDTHSLIIGATRSGKSRRLIMPSIWAIGKTEDSMVITDPKGELYKKCNEYLKNQGYNVILLDFRNPRRGNTWNPLTPVNRFLEQKEEAKATEAAWDISNTIVSQKPSKGDPIWKEGKESLIAALILATAYEAGENEKHMGSVYNVLAKLGASTPNGQIPLNDYIDSLPEQHVARLAYTTARISPYRMRASFFGDASATLRLWSDPSIVELTAKQDHSLENIAKEKTAVFLVIPDEKSTRHVLATIYLEQVYQALVDLTNQNKEGKLNRKVYLILDEFGNLPAISEFDKKISVAGGRGMKFCLVVQDIAQLKKNYKDSVNTITSNCRTWVYLATDETSTAKSISDKLGNYTTETKTRSTSSGSQSKSSSTSYGLTKRPLMTTDEILRWPADYCLIMKSREYPAKLPLPDLSKLPADKDLISIEEYNERRIENTPVWSPDVNVGDGELEESEKEQEFEEIRLEDI